MNEFRDHIVAIGFGSRPKLESFGDPNLDLRLELALGALGLGEFFDLCGVMLCYIYFTGKYKNDIR